MAKKFNIKAVITLDDLLTQKLGKVEKKMTLATRGLSKVVSKLDKVKGGDRINKALLKSVRLAGKLSNKLKSVSKIGAGMAIAGMAAVGYGISKMLDPAEKKEMQLKQLRADTNGTIGSAKSLWKVISDLSYSSGGNRDALFTGFTRLATNLSEPMKALTAASNLSAKTGLKLDTVIGMFENSIAGGTFRLLQKKTGFVKKTDGNKIWFEKMIDGQKHITKAFLKGDKKGMETAVVSIAKLVGAGGNDISNNSFEAAKNSLSNAWEDLVNKFMISGGVLDAIKKKFDIISKGLQDGNLGKRVIELGDKFASFISSIDLQATWNKITDILSKIKSHFEDLLPMLKALGSFAQMFTSKPIVSGPNRMTRRKYHSKRRQQSLASINAKGQNHANLASINAKGQLPPINVTNNITPNKVETVISNGNKTHKTVKTRGRNK